MPSAQDKLQYMDLWAVYSYFKCQVSTWLFSWKKKTCLQTIPNPKIWQNMACKQIMGDTIRSIMQRSRHATKTQTQKLVEKTGWLTSGHTWTTSHLGLLLHSAIGRFGQVLCATYLLIACTADTPHWLTRARRSFTHNVHVRGGRERGEWKKEGRKDKRTLAYQVLLATCFLLPTYPC